MSDKDPYWDYNRQCYKSKDEIAKIQAEWSQQNPVIAAVTIPHFLQHVQRPWGEWFNILELPGYKVKVLVVKQGGKLSVQRHFHRSETWWIVSGVGVFNDSELLSAGAQRYIPQLQWHTVMNNGEQPLVILEIQQGSECLESDIERQ